MLASTAPSHLVCQYQQDTGLSLFHEAYRHGGGGQRGPLAFGGVPTTHFRLGGKKDGETMSAWADHPYYDDYWAQQDATPELPRNDTPCLTIGSWFDFMCQGSIATYVGKKHLGAKSSRESQTLICGPWLHGGSGGELTVDGTLKVRELDFPPQAAFPYMGGMRAHMIDYFKQQMGLATKVPPELAPAAVQYYVMGAVGEPGAPGNEWRHSDDFPIPARPTKYFLHIGGMLEMSCPANSSSTEVVADPAARADNLTKSVAFPGAMDARDFEQQTPYVRTFTSAPLTEAVEWTGAVHAAVFVELGAADCDVIVRISDVYPDGRSILLCDYHRRASFRHGLNRPPSLSQPGEVVELNFRVGWMSQIFNSGHQIRTTISCTGLPLYETGGNGTDENIGRAIHKVIHSEHTPSHVLAPVIPSDGAGCVDVCEDFVGELAAGVFPA
eukprot:SAG31_NODE_4946_length_2843_cov_1.656341_2_plen_441_part_00